MQKPWWLGLTYVASFACGGAATSTPVPPTLTVSPPGPLSLYVGQSQNFSVVTNPAGLQVLWQSTSPAVASVDPSGKATALADGSANIVATIEGGAASRFAALTVKTMGPRNPSFETSAPHCPFCPLGGSTCICAAEWTMTACNSSFCIACYMESFVQGVPQMPSDGIWFLQCRDEAEIYQDNVDFGSATSMSFSYYVNAQIAGAGDIGVSMSFVGNTGQGRQTLWSQEVVESAGVQTATVALPPNLGVGRLLITTVQTTMPNWFYIDGIKVH